MHFRELLSMIKEYIPLVLLISVVFVIAYFILYRLAYKNLLHGKKEIQAKKMIPAALFLIYCVVVVFVTSVSRMGYAYMRQSLEDGTSGRTLKFALCFPL